METQAQVPSVNLSFPNVPLATLPMAGTRVDAHMFFIEDWFGCRRSTACKGPNAVRIQNLGLNERNCKLFGFA